MDTAKTASILAFSTTMVFLLLLAVVVTDGVSQQYFEMVHSPEIYTNDIVQHSAALNIILALDNIFIVLYTSTALFTIISLAGQNNAYVCLTAGVFAILVGILDFIENFHIYALMQQAKGGIKVAADDIRWQSAESMLKWHLAYFTFFLLGFLLPSKTNLEKMLKYSLWFWFLPTGVLVYAVAGKSLESLFQWIRFLNLITGFILISLIMRHSKD